MRISRLFILWPSHFLSALFCLRVVIVSLTKLSCVAGGFGCVQDFFYEPIVGLSRSPVGFATGVFKVSTGSHSGCRL